jgi:transcriptional regulator with XRE-family HTH domain
MITPLGAIIRTLRKEKGLTQGELAKLAGICQPNLSRYEHNTSTPRPRTLAWIAEALGVGLEAFNDPELVKKAMESVCPTCGRAGP